MRRVDISIHAPRTGSDYDSLDAAENGGEFQSTLPARGATRRGRAWLVARAFQSTLPARGATRNINQRTDAMQFQSTLPARGATESSYQASSDTSISIHAPRTGSDRPFPASGGPGVGFQSTLPARGATLAALPAPRTSKSFQSTLPARGATFLVYGCPNIHGYFNPRSPHGERRSCSRRFARAYLFQSTLPARGATRPSHLPSHRAPISIHAPRTGSDLICLSLTP